ncbi:MAG: hypothetical protein R3349_03915 [Geminicoccaceae bacterium]|nr:hypothetical protein [Geminicoccaceae bacterium]
MPNTVLLKRAGADSNVFKEGKASAAIKPGNLIEMGGANDVQNHSGAAAAGNFPVYVALDGSFSGLAVGNAKARTIDDDYATGEQVRYLVARPGDVLYMTLDTGENVAKGASLESAGNGNVQAVTTGRAVAVALEAVNATGAAARIRAEII